LADYRKLIIVLEGSKRDTQKCYEP